MSGDGEAGVPENEAPTPSGIAPEGNDAMPDDDGTPPIDGGVLGAVPPTGTVAPTGVTVDGDRDGELPPEESGR